MRHRYRVSLYDSDELDRDLIDYIDDSQRRQELLRSLLRVGYSVLIRKEDDATAYLSSLTKDDLVRLTSINKIESNTRESYIGRDTVPSNEYSTRKWDEPTKTPNLNNGQSTEVASANTGEHSTHGNEFADDPVDFMDILKA